MINNVVLEEIFTKQKENSYASIEGLTHKYGYILETQEWPGYIQGHSKDIL